MDNTEQIPVVEQQPGVVTDDVKPVQDTPGLETAAPGDVEQKQEEQTPKTFTQAEVDALIQKRLLKEERRVHRRIEQQLRERSEQHVAQVPPKREDFKDDAAFSEAEIEHLAARKAQELLDKRERDRLAETRAEKFLEKAEKASERYPDFHAVVNNPTLQINDAMAEYIADSDLGDEVAYFLGKNPAKAAQIARLTPVGAARELTRLEVELAAKPKATPSNAPDPIKPVGSRGKVSSSTLPSDSDDIGTWMKKERERVRQMHR